MRTCANCEHRILEIGNNKFIHYNKHYFGLVSINHEICVMCNVLYEKGKIQAKSLCMIPIRTKPQKQLKTLQRDLRKFKRA